MIKGYAYINDLKIYYEDSQTELEPILFLHGNNEDHTYFKTVRGYFEDNYRLIFIDSRDHGLSSKSEDNLDFEVMANDVYEVLKKLNIKKTKIIGFSDGASIALQLSIDHKELVDELVLVGANFNPQGMKKETLKKIKNDYLKNSLLSSINEKEKDLKKKNLLMLKHPNFLEIELEKINARVLNIAGSNDCIELEHTQKLTSLLKAKEIIFQNATHDLILEYPDLFAEKVITFFKIRDALKVNEYIGLLNYNQDDSFLNYLDYKDEEVQKYFDIQIDFKNKEEFINYFGMISYNEKLTIVDLVNMRRVGFVGLINNELVLRIFNPYRGNGYGYKALILFIEYLKEREYKYIHINILETNRYLEKLVKKCGFVKDYLDFNKISNRTKDVITLHSYVFRLDK